MTTAKNDIPEDLEVVINGKAYLYNGLPDEVKEYVQQVHDLDNATAKLDFKRNQKIAAKTHFMNLIQEIIVENKIESVEK